jgi:hypothetical protein
MKSNKLNQELASHSVLTLSSKSDQKKFINEKVSSFSACDIKVDLIVVSEDSIFSDLVEKCKGRKGSVSYVTGKDELSAAVDTIQFLMAHRAALFSAASVKDWNEFNQNTNNSSPAQLVCFDVEGSEMWNEHNFESFSSLSSVLSSAKDFGIFVTFFNLTESSQKMALELSL